MEKYTYKIGRNERQSCPKIIKIEKKIQVFAYIAQRVDMPACKIGYPTNDNVSITFNSAVGS